MIDDKRLQLIRDYVKLMKLYERAITYEGYEEGLDDAAIGDNLANLRELMTSEEIEYAQQLSQH